METPGLVSAVGREQENVEPEVAPWGAPGEPPVPGRTAMARGDCGVRPDPRAPHRFWGSEHINGH